MKRSRFSESQIVGVLKEADSGVAVKDMCRKHGIAMPFITSGSPSTGAWRYRIFAEPAS